MKPLPTTGRPCRGRTIGWALVQRKGMITVRAFKRDSTGQSFMAEQSACLLFLSNCETPRSLLANLLLAVRAQVRWAVSQVEFERQGLTDPTPKPSASWPSHLPEFIAGRKRGIDTRHATGTWEPGQ